MESPSTTDLILIAVIAGLIVSAIVGLARWAWKKRNLPKQAAESIRTAATGRRKRQETESNDQLVNFVLKRAAVIDQNVPVSKQGSSPTVVTYHPSGQTSVHYSDLPSYKAGAERLEHHGRNAHVGQAPKIVSQWTPEELQSWLTERAHLTPETAST